MIDYKNDQKNSQNPQDYYHLCYFHIQTKSWGKVMSQIDSEITLTQASMILE